MKKESSIQAPKKALRKAVAISRCYGFEIGKRMIEVKAISEKHALFQIVGKYWELIDDAGEIKLLGEGIRNGS